MHVATPNAHAVTALVSIAKLASWRRAVDPFAGYGVTASFLSREGFHVLAHEKLAGTEFSATAFLGTRYGVSFGLTPGSAYLWNDEGIVLDDGELWTFGNWGFVSALPWFSPEKQAQIIDRMLDYTENMVLLVDRSLMDMEQWLADVARRTDHAFTALPPDASVALGLRRKVYAPGLVIFTGGVPVDGARLTLPDPERLVTVYQDPSGQVTEEPNE